MDLCDCGLKGVFFFSLIYSSNDFYLTAAVNTKLTMLSSLQDFRIFEGMRKGFWDSSVVWQGWLWAVCPCTFNISSEVLFLLCLSWKGTYKKRHLFLSLTKLYKFFAMESRANFKALQWKIYFGTWVFQAHHRSFWRHSQLCWGRMECFFFRFFFSTADFKVIIWFWLSDLLRRVIVCHKGIDHWWAHENN